MKYLNLKKFAVSTIAASALIVAAAPTQAATVTSNFNVDITLTSLCAVSTPANLSFAYTTFQAAASVASTPFSVTCANALPYTVGLSGANVTDDAVGLAYSLVVTAPAGGGTGTGAAQAYSIDGTIAAGQAGTCTTATCTNAAATNNVKTITVTY